MRIEANPSPEHLKWLLLALLITIGATHDQLMVMVGL